MTALFRAFQNLLLKFPATNQAVQTGVLMGAGDFIAQTLVEKKSLKQIDLGRLGRFTIIGTIFVGPPLRIWYSFLEKYFGKEGKFCALKKAAADQFIFSPVFLGMLLGVVGASQGKNLEEIKTQMKQDYPDVLKNNYKFWPGAQLCIFYLVPLRHQVITVQFVAIFWNTYFSWKTNASTQGYWKAPTSSL